MTNLKPLFTETGMEMRNDLMFINEDTKELLEATLGKQLPQESLQSKKIKKVIIECEDGSTYAGDITRIEGNPFKVGGTIVETRVTEPIGFYGIEKVIFDNPATIVYWADGTKTVVVCNDNMKTWEKIVDGKKTKVKKPLRTATYSKEIGLAMCICKKCFGNKGNYNNIFRKFGAI